MSTKTEKLTQTFTAKDASGRKRKLYVFTTFVTSKQLSGPSETFPGTKSIRTSDEQHVNRVAKGHYEVVGTGETLRSDEPDAP